MDEINKGTIGEIVHVSASFGSKSLHKERMAKKELGGGSLLDKGIYTVNLAQMAFGDKAPVEIKATGGLNGECKNEKLIGFF